MNIEKDESGFSAIDNGEKLGYITYIPSGDTLTVTHTVVDEKAEGQGIGKQLVKQVVEFARNEKKTIDPQCPFAASVIEKNPDFQDVLKQ